MADEPRLDRIEEKLDSEILASATFRGELRQFMSNSDSYVKAVSAKAEVARKLLDDHKADLDAHGSGAKRQMTGGFLTTLTAVGGFSGLIGAGFHWLMTHGDKR